MFFTRFWKKNNPEVDTSPDKMSVDEAIKHVRDLEKERENARRRDEEEYRNAARNASKILRDNILEVQERIKTRLPEIKKAYKAYVALKKYGVEVFDRERHAYPCGYGFVARSASTWWPAIGLVPNHAFELTTYGINPLNGNIVSMNYIRRSREEYREDYINVVPTNESDIEILDFLLDLEKNIDEILNKVNTTLMNIVGGSQKKFEKQIESELAIRLGHEIDKAREAEEKERERRRFEALYLHDEYY